MTRKVRKNEWNRDRSEMRAGRRQKLFRQETGWRETEYAGVSVISLTSAWTFADKNHITRWFLVTFKKKLS
jgi:hypothetical protein